ncbi:MAG: hypothetical protein E7422_10920 [Ruminococcaceae bacterium]|jgi:hypothetical protein|nr:hypothetical protein [Oscillospiraceae bacterium]
MVAEDIILHQTCDMCPEQYDAVDQKGKMLGYLRLRWGNFTVECPDVWGELVYEAQPEGFGCFEDDEREEYLQKAKKAIAEYWNRQA